MTTYCFALHKNFTVYWMDTSIKGTPMSYHTKLDDTLMITALHLVFYNFEELDVFFNPHTGTRFVGKQPISVWILFHLQGRYMLLNKYHDEKPLALKC